jgi:hypothetical protein
MLVVATGLADKLARLAIGDVSYRAGVDDVDVGALIEGHDAQSSAREGSREFAAFRLIYFTTQRGDGDGGRFASSFTPLSHKLLLSGNGNELSTGA